MVTSSSYGLAATYNDLFDDVATQMRFFQELTDFCNAASKRPRAGCKRPRFGAV
jgi:hypothetical protein